MRVGVSEVFQELKIVVRPFPRFGWQQKRIDRIHLGGVRSLCLLTALDLFSLWLVTPANEYHPSIGSATNGKQRI